MKMCKFSKCGFEMFETFSNIDTNLSVLDKKAQIYRAHALYANALKEYKIGTKKWRRIRREETLYFEIISRGMYFKEKDPNLIEEDYLINCSKQLLNGELISDKHFLRVAILLGLLIFEDRELPTILSLYDQRKLQVRED